MSSIWIWNTTTMVSIWEWFEWILRYPWDTNIYIFCVKKCIECDLSVFFLFCCREKTLLGVVFFLVESISMQKYLYTWVWFKFFFELVDFKIPLRHKYLYFFCVKKMHRVRFKCFFFPFFVVVKKLIWEVFFHRVYFLRQKIVVQLSVV